MKKLLLGLAALAGAPATAALLPPKPVVVDGKLTGANGVVFNGQVYNVTFQTGSCVQLFSGCDAASDLDFTTLLAAQQAAQALLDQVFVTLGGVDYDADPSLVLGCSSECYTYVPYGAAGGITYAAVAQQAAFDAVGNTAILANIADPGTNFARFTLASAGAVPEPATWAMMIAGFGMIGAARRRRVRATAAA